MSLLSIENLFVNYGNICALRGVSLHVDEGEIVTLVGGNGAGKTTTLMSVNGLTDKTGGAVCFDGTDITDLNPYKIVHMGIAHVPEGREIFADLTVKENLLAGSIGNPSVKTPEAKRLLEEQYELFPRLKEREKQYGGNLSGGEQQMLAIARGLMMKPKLLMLDEPSLGLAPIVVEEIFELITRISKSGVTVLLIEQNASMALSIADRGYVIENGQIVLEGTGRELLVNEDVKKAYLGA